MDFCDLDAPWGHVGKARDVLDFLCQTLCWPGRDEEISLSYSQYTGLALILLACSETLKRAEEDSHKE